MRAAALTALARFGAACPELRDRVLLLLKRTLHDNDDEVRVGRGCGRRVSCCNVWWNCLAAAGVWRCVEDGWAGGWHSACSNVSLPCSTTITFPAPPRCPPPPLQVRDRATLYLYQLQHAPQGPDSVDPHWRIPARALDEALQAYLAQPETEQPFDLVGVGAPGGLWRGRVELALDCSAWQLCGCLWLCKCLAVHLCIDPFRRATGKPTKSSLTALLNRHAGERAGDGGGVASQGQGQASGPGGSSGGRPQLSGGARDAGRRVCG